MSEKSSALNLSFNRESYERSSNVFGQRISHRSLPDAITPPFSWRRVCLPNEDGSYRPYIETAETELYANNTGTYYFLRAVACPKTLKCTACPLR